MLKVLNCGIGMIIIVNKNDSNVIIKELKKIRMNSFEIGYISNGKGTPKVEYVNM
jgi:phosphoribosylaminoimidazole (AIR) synthetase